MKHYGDITKINGAEVEPVDCVIGGSPCQDLSVAGKRAGLQGERSGLFMEQIRVIKEMREHGISKSRVQQIVKLYGWTDIGEWTDTKGKKHETSDSARYKALGNSIAIPPWTWVLERLCKYGKATTMASLFDGIGGFPLIWERINGKGSAIWASEIEEFPIAVTKWHFPENDSESEV